MLIGQSGRNLLVGGTGSDRISGNADDGILVAAAKASVSVHVMQVAVRFTDLTWKWSAELISSFPFAPGGSTR